MLSSTHTLSEQSSHDSHVTSETKLTVRCLRYAKPLSLPSALTPTPTAKLQYAAFTATVSDGLDRNLWP